MLIGIAIVVGVIALAVRFRTETRDTAAYLTLAKEIADDEAQLSQSLASLLEDLATLDRPELMRRIELLSSSADELRGSLDDVVVTGTIAEVHGFLIVASTSWRDALAGLDDGVVAVLESPDGTDGEVVLREVFELLEVGDRAYDGFEDAIGRLDPDLVTQTYPEVVFVGPGQSNTHSAEAVTRRLTASSGLADRYDVSVTATLDPAPVGDRNGVPVVPFGTTFVVNVVVANVGNLDAAEMGLDVSLLEVGGDEVVQSRSELLTDLGAGGATTVVVDDFTVDPGKLYEVTARVTLAEDTDPDNDVWSVLFLRNEE
ncbi:MAG: hypothetical protein KJP12_02005 [Acidimicrobiia bacterium]|nr:hypothetical protein [Acidimicrobiia bacterium]MBT8213967.1 hypothetical protein [Acidimicrobiia bacterium]NNF68733.1 hypothetical protein [Acidimicrobiia bacterium]